MQQAVAAHLTVAKEAAVTVSMRVMSAGDGYKYLLRTVAAADGDRSLSTPLTRYYAEAGPPPGQWLGSGVASLGKGEVAVGDRVSEAQLQLLMGMGRDPITGDPLGPGVPRLQVRLGTDRGEDRRSGLLHVTGCEG
ncbi:relaxase domain-containing protein [Desertihabitans brevis]|uniref:relaxase domain-containing protein n=1 Tax=Desertihabitans brevis TaxID=2268447 RepID=UPI002D76BE86|nr:relaxase domain-containing protein [Desertihabitans brevis]